MSPKVEATERWWERKKTIRLPIWVEGNKLQGLYMLNFRGVTVCLFFGGVLNISCGERSHIPPGGKMIDSKVPSKLDMLFPG